jgi:lipid-binding SYLF domain-containing protein
MKTQCLAVLFVSLVLSAAPLHAASKEAATIESASSVLTALTAIPLKGIPATLLRQAKGIAIVPGVVKAGFVVGGRFGRGVIVVRQADGTWSNPVFVTLTGGSVGAQAGIQSTDVVLVFEASPGLYRILNGKGKLTLGADAAVAAGPIGRQAEAATDSRLRAEIYSYSRSRGLFAGVSLEGAGLLLDAEANGTFYGTTDVGAGKVLSVPDAQSAALVNQLKSQLESLSGPPTAPPPPPPNVPLLPPTPAPIPGPPAR